MISINPDYEPYDLPLAEIREVWKFVHYISSKVPESTENKHLYHQIKAVKKELEQIKRKL